MSSEIETERQKTVVNGNGRGLRKKTTPVACISKNLFETPPQSQFFPLQFVYTVCHLYLVSLSKFVYGQFFITLFDFYMIKLEKTLDFCVPQEMSAGDIAEIHRKTLTTTDRPMTWIFFIPALIVLRLFRFWLSVASIIMGQGEVTAKQMQMKIVAFRRYYRSVRHYAVKKFKPDELKLMEDRCASSIVWRIIYNIDGRIFMRKPPVEIHSNMPIESSPLEQTDKPARLRNGGSESLKKNSLNEIDDDSTDDEALSTLQMLEKYSKLKDSPADVDYEPEEEPSSEEISSDGGADSEEEKTESQKHLNGEDSANTSSNLSGNGSINGYASDVGTNGKSKQDPNLALDENQMLELENQLVQKIMSHFKSNFNYTPTSATVDDVFYSPIGSPPDRGYTSDSDAPLKTNEGVTTLISSLNSQIQENTSSSPKKTAQETPNNDQVVQQQP